MHKRHIVMLSVSPMSIRTQQLHVLGDKDEELPPPPRYTTQIFIFCENLCGQPILTFFQVRL